MIANTAFLAAIAVFLGVAWLASELSFLAPYRSGIFRQHGPLIGVAALILFLNVFGLFYTLGRWLFLRDTGRKLSHVDRQMAMSDGVLSELTSDLMTGNDQ